MSKKTHINPFSKQDIEILEANPYVASVSEMTVRFTEEFKDIAYAGKKAGTPLSEIFRVHGIDPAILGSSRLEGFSYTMNKRSRKDRTSPQRSNTRYQRPSKTGEESLMERIEQLEHELAYTRQEVEFLKKIQNAGMEEQKVWESKHRRK